MAWNGISLDKANSLLNPKGIKIEKNEEEGVYIARHPTTSAQVIRRSNITAVVIAVIENWLDLKVCDISL